MVGHHALGLIGKLQGLASRLGDGNRPTENSLGVLHNNRFAEFDRLRILSGGLTREDDSDALLARMLDFAEAGFLA